MKWTKLTKDAYPDIVKEENIICEDTHETLIMDDGILRNIYMHTVTFKDKAIYIIAIDENHMPDSYECWERKMIDNTHFVNMHYAYHTIQTNAETGEVLCEFKQFDASDTGHMAISVDDENIGYCRYKKVEMEAITE